MAQNIAQSTIPDNQDQAKLNAIIYGLEREKTFLQGILDWLPMGTTFTESIIAPSLLEAAVREVQALIQYIEKTGCTQWEQILLQLKKEVAALRGNKKDSSLLQALRALEHRSNLEYLLYQELPLLMPTTTTNPKPLYGVSRRLGDVNIPCPNISSVPLSPNLVPRDQTPKADVEVERATNTPEKIKTKTKVRNRNKKRISEQIR